MLEDRNMEQKELSELSGVGPNTISDMCLNKNKTFSRNNIVAIMKVQGLVDINQLITVELTQKDDAQ